MPKVNVLQIQNVSKIITFRLRAEDVDVGMLGSVVGVGAGEEAKVAALVVFISHLHQQAVVVDAPVVPVFNSVCNLLFSIATRNIVAVEMCSTAFSEGGVETEISPQYITNLLFGEPIASDSSDDRNNEKPLKDDNVHPAPRTLLFKSTLRPKV